jgi:hypothetical protein
LISEFGLNQSCRASNKQNTLALPEAEAERAEPVMIVIEGLGAWASAVSVAGEEILGHPYVAHD